MLTGLDYDSCRVHAGSETGFDIDVVAADVKRSLRMFDQTVDEFVEDLV